MARATQLRLNQITGSLGTSQINDQIAAVATGSIAAENFETILSHLAGAIKRIHGDDSFSESSAGEFHQDLKLNSTNKLLLTSIPRMLTVVLISMQGLAGLILIRQEILI